MLSVIFKSKYTSAVNYSRLMLQEVDTQCVILIQIRVNMWINYIPSIIISKSTRKRKQGSSIVATIDKTLSLASNHECGDLRNINVPWNYQVWLSVSKMNLMSWHFHCYLRVNINISCVTHRHHSTRCTPPTSLVLMSLIIRTHYVVSPNALIWSENVIENAKIHTQNILLSV